jgi:hypothetical protein
MYITQILQYLIWPAFILLSWVIVDYALSAYEKNFPQKEESAILDNLKTNEDHWSEEE